MHTMISITLLLDRVCHYLDFNKQFLLNFRQVCHQVNDFITFYYSHITLSEWEISALLIKQNGEPMNKVDYTKRCVDSFPIFCERKGVKIYLIKHDQESYRLVFETPFNQTKQVLVHSLQISLTSISGRSTVVFNKNFTLDGSARNLLCLFQVRLYDSDGLLEKCDIIDYTNILHPIIYKNIQLKSEVDFWEEPHTFESILFDSYALYNRLVIFSLLPFAHRMKLTQIPSIDMHDYHMQTMTNHNIVIKINKQIFHIYKGAKQIMTRFFSCGSESMIFCNAYLMTTSRSQDFIEIYDFLSSEKVLSIEIPFRNCYIDYFLEISEHHFIFKFFGENQCNQLVDLKQNKIVNIDLPLLKSFRTKTRRINQSEVLLFYYKFGKIWLQKINLINLTTKSMSDKSIQQC
jgi:hypothetical protein